MRTAIVSDLHLGTTSGADLARRPDVFEPLAAALSEADRVVVLGDLLELRERPATEVLEPGNHDHPLVSPALDRARLNGDGRLAPAASFDTSASELALRVAERMPDADVELAYPGVWLRDDVYATHGHYLDLHLTVPRVECVVGSAIGRSAAAARRPTGADAYEAALAPLYAFAYSVVQGLS